ncbi:MULTISPECIES: M20 family metallopeptidase [Microbacterium]|uniref:Peptidase M20 domain-containing protein 2 n=1 Tax=Microbacterium algihabitans TaxID=3075992 RepID=A0ABU3RS41_9MICO|nr:MULTISPECIES: M20 family metallopeptidase [Microbacterium]MDU0325711.1 M20 family metallopeptidase [Microbacterium sp. KSW2-21]
MSTLTVRSTAAASIDAMPTTITELRPFLERRLATLVDVAADLHAHPEIRFTETHAAARLTAELELAGFAIERGFAGLETAFVARWSTTDADAPTIAIFCEYDALEEIGHACGHNIIAACGLGAGLLVKDALEASPVPANLVVIGSPGEEGAAGKVPMIEGGVLDGVDLAMMVHPSGTDAVRGSSLSRVALDIDFHGKAAHAAAAPELGRNALDGATLALTAIGMLRQQMTDDVRIHAIITNGGQAPNIIPERASLRIFVRAADRDHLLSNVVPRVRDCFEGAAIATGTTVEIAENTPPYFSLRSNPTLVDVAEAAYSVLGRDLEPDPTVAGSTDMGNVSHVVPSIHPMICLARDVAPHTREFAAAAGSAELAPPTIADGALMLAATALSAFREPSVVADAKATFARD